MTKKKYVLFSFMFACIILLQPIMLFANSISPRKATGRYWANVPRNVYFYFDESTSTRVEASDASSAIQSAMNAWNAVRDGSGNKMVTLGLTSDSSSANTIKFILLPLTNMFEYAGRTEYTPEEGTEIESAKVWLNARYLWATDGSDDGLDTQTIVQHELGHVLGVAHCHETDESSCFSATCSSNVMQPTFYYGDVYRSFTDYDTSSYIVIYW